MSRIGKMPVVVPAGVTVEIAEGNHVTVKGPKGELSRDLAPEMEIKKDGDNIVVTRPNDLKRMKSLHGRRVRLRKMDLPARPIEVKRLPVTIWKPMISIVEQMIRMGFTVIAMSASSWVKTSVTARGKHSPSTKTTAMTPVA